jgi:hypothetical protein
MFIGATLLSALKGEAKRLRCANRRSAGIRSANKKFSRIFLYSLLFAY